MNVSIGQEIPEWVMESVSAERMKTMAAILRDPNLLHWDREAVDAIPLGLGKRAINQGPLGLSYMVNMLHAWAGPGCLKRLKMTFPQVVLDGERVVARGLVTAIDGNIVHCDVWLEEAERGKLLVGSAKVDTGDAHA